MIKLEIKNIKEIEGELLKEQFTQLCNSKRDYLEEHFKNYDKALTMEVIVNRDGEVYKVSASLNMKSKKILLAEEGKEILKVASKLMKEFTKSAKHQKELERKDFLYKRKR